jgi:hypothetical protein
MHYPLGRWSPRMSAMCHMRMVSHMSVLPPKADIRIAASENAPLSTAQPNGCPITDENGSAFPLSAYAALAALPPSHIT